MAADLSPQDNDDIQAVLDLWFRARAHDTPGVDARMNFWFGEDAELDIQIRHRFGDLIKRAAAADLEHWAGIPLGRLALIIVIDQRAFFFMPMQHVESRKVQNKSVAVYQGLVKQAGEAERDTFETFSQFAELHRDIVEQFGRFPHRNAILGRENTPLEAEYLADDAPDFGQG